MKRYLYLLILAFISFGAGLTPAKAIDTRAQFALLMDAETGIVLYEKTLMC